MRFRIIRSDTLVAAAALRSSSSRFGAGGRLGRAKRLGHRIQLRRRRRLVLAKNSLAAARVSAPKRLHTRFQKVARHAQSSVTQL